MNRPQCDTHVLEWASGFATGLACGFTVASGAAGIVLLGQRRGRSLVWRNAADMEGADFGGASLPMSGPLHPIILEELHKLAHKRLSEATLHAQDGLGAVFMDRLSREWCYRTPDGTLTRLGSANDCALLDIAALGRLGCAAKLGMNGSTGGWQRVVGALEDGAMAYVDVRHQPSKIIVPCPLGHARSLLLVVEREDGLDVVGFRMTRSNFSRRMPTFTSICDTLRARRYFPLWHEGADGRRQIRVLRLPR